MPVAARAFCTAVMLPRALRSDTENVESDLDLRVQQVLKQCCWQPTSCSTVKLVERP